MPRARPYRNWRFSDVVGRGPLTTEESDSLITAVETGAQVQLTDEAKVRLLQLTWEAIKAYYAAAHEESGPTRGAQKAGLEQLLSAGEALRSIVRSLDDASIAALIRPGGDFGEAFSKQPRSATLNDRLASTLNIVESLLINAQAAASIGTAQPEPLDWTLNRLVDFWGDTGQRGSAMRVLIMLLADTFRDVVGVDPVCYPDRTEQKIYMGNFLRYATAVAGLVEQGGREAFGRTVQDILHDWRFYSPGNAIPGQER